MENILIEGKRLRLRRANISDVEYIIALASAPENLPYIFPFDEKFHVNVINSDNSAKMDGIVEEIATGTAVGYFMLSELDSPSNKVEYTQLIIEKKGIGYGRETFELLMRWSFEVRKFHRVYFDCKEYNSVALRLYESLGFQREGIMRETLLTNGVYENLILLGILDREYFLRGKDSGFRG